MYWFSSFCLALMKIHWNEIRSVRSGTSRFIFIIRFYFNEFFLRLRLSQQTTDFERSKQKKSNKQTNKIYTKTHGVWQLFRIYYTKLDRRRKQCTLDISNDWDKCVVQVNNQSPMEAIAHAYKPLEFCMFQSRDKNNIESHTSIAHLKSSVSFGNALWISIQLFVLTLTRTPPPNCHRYNFQFRHRFFCFHSELNDWLPHKTTIFQGNFYTQNKVLSVRV